MPDKKKNYTLRLQEDTIKKASIRAIMEDTKLSIEVEKFLVKYADGVDLDLKKLK